MHTADLADSPTHEPVYVILKVMAGGANEKEREKEKEKRKEKEMETENEKKKKKKEAKYKRNAPTLH